MIQEDVARFDVPVDDASTVAKLQGRQYAAAEVERLRREDRIGLRKSALHKWHHSDLPLEVIRMHLEEREDCGPFENVKVPCRLGDLGIQCVRVEELER